MRAPDPVRVGLSSNPLWEDASHAQWVDLLCTACCEGRREYVNLLLKEADPDPAVMVSVVPSTFLGVNAQRLSDGFTPLHCACSNGHYELAVDLLTRGADPTLKDFRGRLAFKLGSDTVRAVMVEWLQANASAWPYRVVGLIPGVSGKEEGAGKKDKKKKGGKKGSKKSQKPQQGAPGSDVDEDDLVLEAAAVEREAIRVMAQRRLESQRAQDAAVAAVRSVAGRLGVAPSELTSLLGLQGAGGTEDPAATMGALSGVTAALDAGMGAMDVLASLTYASESRAPVRSPAPSASSASAPPRSGAAAPPAPATAGAPRGGSSAGAAPGAVGASAAAAAAAPAPATPARGPAPPALVPCVSCGKEMAVTASVSTSPAVFVCSELCNRRHRANMAAQAAERRKAAPTPE